MAKFAMPKRITPQIAFASYIARRKAISIEEHLAAICTRHLTETLRGFPHSERDLQKVAQYVRSAKQKGLRSQTILLIRNAVPNLTSQFNVCLCLFER